ncbi:MAG: LptF/LptG family permease [Pseudomonadota bacterium]
MSLIDRYILRAVMTPLLLALCVAAMLLLLEQMLRLFDFVLAEQGPVDVVWRMMANLVPHYLGLALPLGVFLGIMLAFRTLSLSSELDALSSSGISFARLLRPIYGLVILLLIFDFLLVGYIQPYGSYKYDQIRFDVTSGAFGIRIQPGEFIELDDGVVIRLGAINKETRKATDIFLERTAENGRKETITAQTGALSASTDLSVLNLELKDGMNVRVAPNGERIQALAFDAFDLTLDLPAIAKFRARGADATEATFTELWRVVRAGRDANPLIYDAFRADFHWRIMQPIAFLVLPILALATGVTGRRRASNTKPLIGIALLIAYHEVVEEWGQVVVAEGNASPYVAIWGVLIIFAVISFMLYNNAIDSARNARLMARAQNAPIRLASAARPRRGLDVSLSDSIQTGATTPATSPVAAAEGPRS